MAIEAEPNTDIVALNREFLLGILPEIEDLDELKVTLWITIQSACHGGAGVRLEDVLAPEVARTLVSANRPDPAPDRVRQALERALGDGVLFRLEWDGAQEPETMLFPGTAQNRSIVECLRQGDRASGPALGLPDAVQLRIHRPNVFALYEHHIGPLTPLIAEHLRDAEQSYPREWLEDALSTASAYNKRNWRYIQAILNEWERTGAPNGVSR